MGCTLRPADIHSKGPYIIHFYLISYTFYPQHGPSSLIPCSRSAGPYPRVEALKINDWVQLSISGYGSTPTTYLPEKVVQNGDSEILQYMLEK